jgi:hypothetical protein
MLITLTKPALTEPFTRPSAARTLGDVRDLLMGLPEMDRPTKLQISAINTVAKASRCAPEDLPADPVRLREQLHLISPAIAGLSQGSWSSVRSRILKALQRVDINVMSSRRTSPLCPVWTPLYQSLPKNGSEAALGRFIGYLSGKGVLPSIVSDASVRDFTHELDSASLRGSPAVIARAAVRSWNTAVDRVPGWPQQRLSNVAKRASGYVLRADLFSPGFQASLAEYMEFLTDPPDDEDAPFKGLKATTLGLREFQLRQLASALVHQGVPIEEITSVDILARRDHVDLICEFFIQHHGRPDSVQLMNLMSALRPIALHLLKDRDLADWVSRRQKRLWGGSTRRFGMTEKNRRRLAVFRDPQHVRDLLLLPYRLLKRAESGTVAPVDVARLIRTAVAIEMQVMAPIRLQNLSEIDLDRDLVRSRFGKGAAVHLFIPGHRTKNGEPIEIELPTQSMALIDLYIAKYRNQLIDPQFRGVKPRFLFPRADGTAKIGKVLADAICSVLLRERGIKLERPSFSASQLLHLPAKPPWADGRHEACAWPPQRGDHPPLL